MSGESDADRDLLAICWQPAPTGGVTGALCLVELRGFEPLTSAMRTNATRFTHPFPGQR